MRKTFPQRGFTLIELMVVIAIVGVLASVIMGGLASARLKAQDSKRKLEFRNISTALRLYRETYGSNPINRNPCCGYPDTQPDFLEELIATGLLRTRPKSPTSPQNRYFYYDYGPGTVMGMLLVTQLEGAAPSTTGYPGSCRPWAAGVNWCDLASNNYYCVCNPY